MSLPKEPRQKMINLMYLVLTALLALNVSAEIINAFKVVDNSLTTTNSVVDRSTTTIMESFKVKLKDPTSAVKAAIWMPKAEQAVKLTKEMSDYIEELKLKLKIEAGYDPKDPESTFKEDNVDVATRVMDKQGEGEKLRKKLEDYRKAMIALDDSVGRALGKGLPINTEVPKLKNSSKLGQTTWTYAYFHMTPTVAALTMLSKFQNDVKTTENRIVNEFHNRVGQVAVIFDTYEPIVGASTTYLFPGQEMEITAGLGAFSKQKLPTVSIAGAPVTLNEKGLAVKKFKVGSTSGSVKVLVNYTDQDGNPQSKETEISYTVGTATGAFVSAEKVKVLYIGLDNELAVSGGNVGDEKVSVSINNGPPPAKIAPGRYIVKPTSPGKAVVTVNADGKTSSFEFRVKTVPDPVAMVGASKGGVMQSNVFKAQRGLRAELENFVFDGVQYTVTSYVIYLTGNGFPEPQFRQVNGNSFDAVQDLINKAKPGTTITFDEIQVTGPGGRRRIAGPFFNLR